MLYWVWVEEAGSLEARILSKLSQYHAPREYFKDGAAQGTYELLTCSFTTARRALQDIIGDKGGNTARVKVIARRYNFEDRER